LQFLTNQKALFFTDKTVTDKKVTFVYIGLAFYVQDQGSVQIFPQNKPNKHLQTVCNAALFC
jgi:hypothetical protein